MTQFVSELSLVISFVAAAIAVLSFARAVSWQLPSVEFLVDRDASDQPGYKLSVSNPTRRLLILDYVEVFAPSAEGVKIWPIEGTVHDTVSRAFEDMSLTSKRLKSVFLAVPAGQTRCLEIEFADDEDFEVKFGLHWSKGLPLPDRCFIARKVRLDAAQVKSRQLAVGARAN